MSMYFRPGWGVTRRDTATRLFVPDTAARPTFSDVTHLRQVTFRNVDTDGTTLEGIATPFNEETIIDSWWEGKFREVMRKGAFAQTITEDRQIIQFDHGLNFTEPGEKPIGAIDLLEERDEGLFIRATLRDTWDVAPVRDAIANGSVSGMSIAFRVREERITAADEDSSELDLREIINVQLFEAGPVTWPAYPTTSVELVSQTPDSDQTRDTVTPFDMPDDESPEGTGDTTEGLTTTQRKHQSRNRAAIARARLWLQ